MNKIKSAVKELFVGHSNVERQTKTRAVQEMGGEIHADSSPVPTAPLSRLCVEDSTATLTCRDSNETRAIAKPGDSLQQRRNQGWPNHIQDGYEIITHRQLPTSYTMAGVKQDKLPIEASKSDLRNRAAQLTSETKTIKSRESKTEYWGPRVLKNERTIDRSGKTAESCGIVTHQTLVTAYNELEGQLQSQKKVVAKILYDGRAQMTHVKSLQDEKERKVKELEIANEQQRQRIHKLETENQNFSTKNTELHKTILESIPREPETIYDKDLAGEFRRLFHDIRLLVLRNMKPSILCEVPPPAWAHMFNLPVEEFTCSHQHELFCGGIADYIWYFLFQIGNTPFGFPYELECAFIAAEKMMLSAKNVDKEDINSWRVQSATLAQAINPSPEAPAASFLLHGLVNEYGQYLPVYDSKVEKRQRELWEKVCTRAAQLTLMFKRSKVEYCWAQSALDLERFVGLNDVYTTKYTVKGSFNGNIPSSVIICGPIIKGGGTCGRLDDNPVVILPGEIMCFEDIAPAVT